MKQKQVLKMVVLAMLVAFGVLISPLLRVEGMCPMAHFINILCSVLLGPWYSLLCATLIGVLRMTLMEIPPLALTGAVFGAFLSGVCYRASKGKILGAVFGEVVGTGIIGAVVSYPVMTYIFGKEGLSWLFYVPSFIMGTLIGGSIAFLFLIRLSKNGMLAKMQGKLHGRKPGIRGVWVDKIRTQKPLIHCMIGDVAANLSANAVLAMGGKPIMASHPQEVAEITRTAGALVLNLSGISESKVEALRTSAMTAKKEDIPTVLDVVGAACSEVRHRIACELAEDAEIAIIKGNYSEIRAMEDASYHALGVDAEEGINAATAEQSAIRLAQRYHTTVLATGKTDIITDGRRIFRVKNGTKQLGDVTGTGCVLGVLCGCYLTVADAVCAAASAAVAMGICGEFAKTRRGNGSFAVRLLNRLSKLTAWEAETYQKVEEDFYENI